MIVDSYHMKRGRVLLENKRRCVVVSGPGPVKDRRSEVMKFRSQEKRQYIDPVCVVLATLLKSPGRS